MAAQEEPMSTHPTSGEAGRNTGVPLTAQRQRSRRVPACLLLLLGGCIAFALIAAGATAVLRATGILSGPAGNADWQPAWSPDGTQIAFTSDRDGNSDVFRMGADGSNIEQLTRD